MAYLGKRSDDVALDLSNQQWHNSDKEVRTWVVLTQEPSLLPLDLLPDETLVLEPEISRVFLT